MVLVQIAAAIVPYGTAHSRTAAPAGGGAHSAIREAMAVTPVTRDNQRQPAWIDAEWTVEQPARAAQAYQRATNGYGRSVLDVVNHAPFLAQNAAQRHDVQGHAMQDQAGSVPHALGAAAYRQAHEAAGRFQRGELGFDLRA